MAPERTTGLVLLTLAFVLGIALLFLPLSEAWIEDGGTRTTHEFGLFTKDVTTAPVGDPGQSSSPQTWYYTDPNLEGTGGITYLTAMGPVAAVGVLFVLLALIVTAVPRTRPSRAGGWLALPGAALLLVAGVLAVLGMPLHAEHEVGREAVFTWSGLGGTVAVVAIFLATLGAGIGLTRRAGATAAYGEPEEDWAPLAEGDDWEDGPPETWEEGSWDESGATPGTPAAAPAGEPGATRYLKCPDCSTVVEAEYNVVPICPDCGFGQNADPSYTQGAGGTGMAA